MQLVLLKFVMALVGEREIIANVRKLAACEILDEAGKPVAIQSLWSDQPAILIFLRHFACDLCQRHALDVWENRSKYEEKGAKIHFISNGNAHFISEFKKLLGLEAASVFTDPTMKAFEAAGFRKGFWIDPGEYMRRVPFMIAAVRHEMRRTGQGSVWQLGGVLAVKPGDKITYQYTSQMLGDFPPSHDVPRMT